MHFCGSEYFGAVSALNDGHTVILVVNSATSYLSYNTIGCVNIIWLVVLYKHKHKLCVMQFSVKSFG